jgi:hypothetical protein
MRTRVIDHDPITNITSYFHDDGDGHFTTWEEQYVEPILERNQDLRRRTKRSDRWGAGKYVAEIPNVVLMQLRKDGILNDPKAFLKWLERKENLPFKTAETRLI